MDLKLADLLTVSGCTVAVTVGIQIFKRYFPERLVPALAILAGIVLAVGASLLLGQTEPAQLGNAALAGFLAGGASVGVYEAQRPVNVLKAKEPDPKTVLEERLRHYGEQRGSN